MDTVSLPNDGFNSSYADQEEDDELYAYDYQESLNNFPLREFSAVALCYGLAFVIGSIGNSLVVYCVSKHRRMRTTTNYFLLSLACADMLLVVVCIPVKFAEFFSFTWSFGAFVCKLVHYTQSASMVCSILTLTIISLERYYAVSKPIRAKYLCTRRHARVVIVVIWIASLILAVPALFGQVYKEVGDVRKATWCVREWSTLYLAVSYEATIYCVLFIAPATVMTIAYYGVCKQLWMVSADRPEECIRRHPLERTKSIASSASKAALVKMNSDCSEAIVMRKSHVCDASRPIRRQVIKMLVAVVLVFVVCWGPLLTFNLLLPLGTFEEYFPYKYPYVKPMKEAFYLLAYFNSCVNPVIYGFMSRYFRKSFQQALMCCSAGRSGSLSKSTLMRGSIRMGTQALEKLMDPDDALPTPACQRTSSTLVTPTSILFPIFSYDIMSK